MTEKLIYESPNSQIYLLLESEWDIPVIRKTLNTEYPPPSEIARFYNEYDIVSGLELAGIRKVLKKNRYKRRPALYLEYIKGQSLKEGFFGKQNDIYDFLQIAIAICKALGDIHQQHIIHKDISAQNILVDIQARTAKIIDFGISSRINLKTPHLGNPESLEGNLSYISPEQTGRMNRVVDYRTDLYSLGVVFYEMLSGVLPFRAEDAMELVHAHIAQNHTPVHQVNTNVPEVISSIVSKLLCKNAEDRYQSAYGIANDLNNCLRLYETHAKIEQFAIACDDYSDTFQIPQKLYGREQEVKQLISAFQEASEGTLQTVLVKGYSGTGKSALVHEIHKPVTEKRGYFIEGKFDQFQKSIPYFALLQAFQSYIDLLLTESSQNLNALTENIKNSIGNEGQVLTNVLPNLELLLGKQPEVPVLAGSESQNRFIYVFNKFVKAICNKHHPMVLFIDDLQWMDAASLSLLKTLLRNSEIGGLLFIGAYRDNEVNDSHPLSIELNALQDQGLKLQTIAIKNLQQADVKQLIVESVISDTPETAELTGLVYSKTQGNAFFVVQFLSSLYQEKLLFFDNADRVWCWQLEKIKELNITDNVVELMAGKILKLPESSREALKLAACIGNYFDLASLAVINQCNEQEIKLFLQPALAEGLVTPLGEHYKFSHDRIQQAVYSLIAEQQKSRLHLTIGRLLLQNLDQRSGEERLFDIVNQWNQGHELLLDEADRLMLARLNSRAGVKAKQASAFRPAYQYLQTGIELLPEGHWHTHYQLSLQLYTDAAETAYLNADFKSMEEKINAVLENARQLLEKVVPYEIRILAYKAENRLLDAIATGMDVLQQLGEQFPKNPGMAHVMTDLLHTKLSMRGKPIDYLAALPEMQNPHKIAAMRIIADIASCSYWATPNLFPLLIFRMCRLSLRYGDTALSAFGFASYGVIMCGVLGAMKSGHEYGKLGLMLLDRFQAREWLTQIYCPIYALIINWNEHVENTLEPLRESYYIGLETGAVEFACINANIYCIHAYLVGRPLVQTESETKAYSDSFNYYKQETNYNYNEVYRQAMLNFMGKSKNPLILTGNAFDEALMMAQNQQRNDQTGKFFIHFNKLILCCFFHDYQQAGVHAAESRKLLQAVLAKLEIPNHHFYEALSLLALYPYANKAEKRHMLKMVRGNMSKLKKWATYAPQNYEQKYLLLRAERFRIRGKYNQAMLVYDQAIQSASKHQYIQEEALAYELAGRFYLARKQEGLAEFHLKAAYNSYREWGAEAKLKHLQQRYPQYIAKVFHAGSATNLTVSAKQYSTFTDLGMLDLSTVLKASTAISGEIVLKNLLQTLIKIVIENAGAQLGYLILQQDTELLVQAKYDTNQSSMHIMQATPIAEVTEMAVQVLHYIHRTGNSVIVNDAVNDERYAQDPHIQNNKPKSILGLPIINQGKFIGILYLENNMSVGAFTQNHIHLLALLAGQIAVSIDNALLYENLEQKVAERTVQLHEEKQKSDNLLLNILPLETANELKQKGKAEPKSYENVTVMFTDFTGFSTMSKQLSAEQLVDEIGSCFAAFDEIISRHGVEKIKTIGDSYMCAGGIPVVNSTHSADIIKAALDIQIWMREHRLQRSSKGLPAVDIRIGVHNGPVIAGVVGTRKFAYDIWGDTVNIAARMESSCEPGCINISGDTYKDIKDLFNCSYRGLLPIKNLPDIEMYYILGVKK